MKRVNITMNGINMKTGTKCINTSRWSEHVSVWICAERLSINSTTYETCFSWTSGNPFIVLFYNDMIISLSAFLRLASDLKVQRCYTKTNDWLKCCEFLFKHSWDSLIWTDGRTAASHQSQSAVNHPHCVNAALQFTGHLCIQFKPQKYILRDSFI